MDTGKKSRTTFRCNNCSHETPCWAGRCPSCNTWDSFVQVEIKTASNSTSNAAAVFAESIAQLGSAHDAVPILDIEAPALGRMSTGIDEFDRVLGGGLVAGSVVLLGGDPGIGKSTLMMQVAMQATLQCETVLYATSEETAYQCKLRAERLCGGLDACKESLGGLHVLADTDLANIQRLISANKPSILIVDSIQMVHRSDLDAAPGSVKQIRRCCLELVYLAREYDMAVFIVGHVTKDG